MDKKIFAVILSVAAMLTAVSLSFLSAIDLLPDVRLQIGSSQRNGTVDASIDVSITEDPAIKDDYFPYEYRVPGETTDEASSESASDATITVDTSYYQSEPVPAAKPAPEDLLLWNLFLVNAEHPLPTDFTVDLTKINGGYLVDYRISDPLEAMIRTAKEDGVSLIVCSAFRTVKSQKALIEKKAQSLMISGLDADVAYAMAKRYIASPGESEHHTGLAVDFLTHGSTTLDESFSDTDAFAWLSKNAARFGFILRYPNEKEDITRMSYEPWHYRYVGREQAAAIHKTGLSLEEYLDLAKEN